MDVLLSSLHQLRHYQVRNLVRPLHICATGRCLGNRSCSGGHVDVVQFPSFLRTAKGIVDQSSQIDAPKQLGKSD